MKIIRNLNFEWFKCLRPDSCWWRIFTQFSVLELVTVVVEARMVEEEVVDSWIVIVFLIGSDKASLEASQVNSSSLVWLGTKVMTADTVSPSTV